MNVNQFHYSRKGKKIEQTTLRIKVVHAGLCILCLTSNRHSIIPLEGSMLFNQFYMPPMWRDVFSIQVLAR